MHLTVIIPTRGSLRSNFLKHSLFMLSRQTRMPDQIIVADYEPKSSSIDITERYRWAYEQATDTDLICFWEDDDYYSSTYIEHMLSVYNGADIMGLSEVMYYHIIRHEYFYMYHSVRSSAMSTFIKPNLDIEWPANDYPYTDIYLWNQIKSRQLIKPPFDGFNIGIKHGLTIAGAEHHTTKLNRYKFADPAMKVLKQIVDKESYDFYSSLAFGN
jgi:hypothetical protein